MKINRITIKGFRGFNRVQPLAIDPKLTVFYAPNSCGKTSISEAVEWLLYGSTTKVDRAGYKEEYKGSYRNRHLPPEETPFVAVSFRDAEKDTEYRSELLPDDSCKRFVDGDSCVDWPQPGIADGTARPFILQHSLKDLLLVKPEDRFHGLAEILGLRELDTIHQNVIALCTKPQSCLSKPVADFLNNVGILESKMASRPSFSHLQKVLAKGYATLDSAYSLLLAECRKHVGAATEESSMIPSLLHLRDEAVGRFFKGQFALADYSLEESVAISQDESSVHSFVEKDLRPQYQQLSAVQDIDEALSKVSFLEIGLRIAGSTVGECPFCGQAIDDDLAGDILRRYKEAVREAALGTQYRKLREELLCGLRSVRDRLGLYQQRHAHKAASLLAVEDTLPQCASVLLPDNEMHYQNIESAIASLSGRNRDLVDIYNEVIEAWESLETSITLSAADEALVRQFCEKLDLYLAAAHQFKDTVSGLVQIVANADKVLKHELDRLAGMEDVSLLVELLEEWPAIRKKYEVAQIFDRVKELRRITDQFVASRVMTAVSKDLTDQVMQWYRTIRTTGDPDVHFSGFDLEKTLKGDAKARRVRINATSYGRDLVSAVSSLSESKLNALGLCISIASNLDESTPYDFLLIDDPIQSWDTDHECRFIDVIRGLVERGKQIVLFSHNQMWVKQVRGGCRSLNGRYYEITGYTEEGPHISEKPWATWTERLNEIDASLKDPSADAVRLQQAEEEIRLALGEIACDLYFRTSGSRKSSKDLNQSAVRKILIESSVAQQLVDKVTATFATTDPAHHAQLDYTPNRQRIRDYYDLAHELTRLLK